jgi:hypothetical protein
MDGITVIIAITVELIKRNEKGPLRRAFFVFAYARSRGGD